MSGGGSGGGRVGGSGHAWTVTTTTTGSTTRRVTAYRLNFRSGPGTNYSIIGVLSYGTRLTVLGSARDGQARTWYRVRAPSGRVGWVASWYTRP
jgi:N-acetylmuramoyl-L-alanine amidase